MKYLITLLSCLVVCFGAIFLAPKAFAVSETDVSDNVSLSADYITAHYPDDNINIDNYYYVCGFNTRLNGFYICFIPSDVEYTLSIYYYGIESLPLNYSSTSTAYCYTMVYTLGTTPTDNAFGRFNQSFVFTLGVNKSNDICYVYKSSELNITNQNSDIITLVDFDVSLNPDNVDFTYIKPILTSYLNSKGWSVSGAYLADSDLSQTKALNIVTNFNDLPDDFEGLYCLRDNSSSGFYKFSVAISPGSNPNDYSDFWDDYLVIVFNSSELTNVTCYFGSSYPQSSHPLALKIGSANWVTDVTSSPMVISSTTFRGAAIGTGFSESQTPQIRVAIRWRYNNTAAIPQPQISPLYVAFDYSNEVEGVVQDGNGSSDYNNYETNYYNTVYRQSISGLTGVYTGQNGISDSFSKPDGLNIAEPSYTGDYDLTYDGNFLYLFEKLMDLEFVSKMLLGVFSISIAIYIIFGSSY